jgi:hypothetical protein
MAEDDNRANKQKHYPEVAAHTENGFFIFDFEPDKKHIAGSLECTANWCGTTSGYFGNIFPFPCPCGGVIHAQLHLPSYLNTDGFYGSCMCDKCKKEYYIDDVIDMRATARE